MNVLVLGGRVIGPELARELMAAYVRAAFTDGERHWRRLEKVCALEARYRAVDERRGIRVRYISRPILALTKEY